MCPTATTCQEQGKNCGSISDGCGGILHCGNCPANQVCGAGVPPVANVCGTPCVGMTCAELGYDCGPVGDGCGNMMDCGTCTAPEICGGGNPGMPNVCGQGAVCMNPMTCQDQGIQCGPAGDGCGNMLDCGSCTLPETCGGGGVAGVCGSHCVPKTCADLNFNCGPAADGCGGLVMCGSCTAPETCGGTPGVPNVCNVPPSCVNLCLDQVTCPDPTVTTTVSGTVYAPNGVDPLVTALVYVPNAPVQAFTPGVSCDNCGAAASGNPLVSVVTGVDGTFTLTNVPVGQNIPLVIQLGRWRRQVTIPNVVACMDNPLPASLTSMPNCRVGNAACPAGKGTGDIPQMAFATGSIDALECVMRKIGIDDSEFTLPAAMGGQGRVHIYTGLVHGGVTINGDGQPTEDKLWGDSSVLSQYDMIFFPCQASPTNEPMQGSQNVLSYANAGGRIFATHFSYDWLVGNGSFDGTATWDVTHAANIPDSTGTINQTFPRGQALAQWLQIVHATTTLGQISLQQLKYEMNGVVDPSLLWITVPYTPSGGSTENVPAHYTFDTPVGNTPDMQCGRVVFDDFHVENYGSAPSTKFPTECDNNAMTPQEKLLEFMIFDLSSCIAPNMPICTPQTCMSLGAQCGPAGDGCGGVIQCGDCPMGQTCGGGGVPSVCGTPPCTQQTCAGLGINCGPAGDGCGGLLMCGSCPMGETCGGGGKPGVCGTQMCMPRTCADQNIECGPAGDGCGGLLECGDCPTGQACGGGGVPGKCGNSCVPKTCVQLNANCGAIGDGCGGVLQCGTCEVPLTCGGGSPGTPNRCGGGAQ
jgi:hypothetical protein